MPSGGLRSCTRSIQAPDRSEDPFHWVTVVLRGGVLAIEYRDSGQVARFELKAGQVDWDEPTDRIHRGVNVGRQPYEEVTVFLLDRPDAVPPSFVRNADDDAQSALPLMVMRCTHCGSAMTPTHTRRRGRLYRYYVCLGASRMGHDTCPVRSIAASEVEGLVLGQVRRLLWPGQAAKTLLLTFGSLNRLIAPARSASRGSSSKLTGMPMRRASRWTGRAPFISPMRKVLPARSGDTTSVTPARTTAGATFERPREISSPQIEPFESASFPTLDLDGEGDPYVVWELSSSWEHPPQALGFVHSNNGGRTFEPPSVVPGTADSTFGFNDSLQGLLMDKLAVNESGAVAVVNSTFKRNEGSHVWLMRGSHRTLSGARPMHSCTPRPRGGRKLISRQNPRLPYEDLFVVECLEVVHQSDATQTSFGGLPRRFGGSLDAFAGGPLQRQELTKLRYLLLLRLQTERDQVQADRIGECNHLPRLQVTEIVALEDTRSSTPRMIRLRAVRLISSCSGTDGLPPLCAVRSAISCFSSRASSSLPSISSYLRVDHSDRLRFTARGPPARTMISRIPRAIGAPPNAQLVWRPRNNITNSRELSKDIVGGGGPGEGPRAGVVGGPSSSWLRGRPGRCSP
jgi:Recombinase zinc beta ribbon domain